VLSLRCNESARWCRIPFAINSGHGGHTECPNAHPRARVVSIADIRYGLGIVPVDGTNPSRKMGRKTNGASPSCASRIDASDPSLGRDQTATLSSDHAACCPPPSSSPGECANSTSFRTGFGAFAEHVGKLSSSRGCSRRVPGCL